MCLTLLYIKFSFSWSISSEKDVLKFPTNCRVLNFSMHYCWFFFLLYIFWSSIFECISVHVCYIFLVYIYNELLNLKYCLFAVKAISFDINITMSDFFLSFFGWHVFLHSIAFKPFLSSYLRSFSGLKNIWGEKLFYNFWVEFIHIVVTNIFIYL